MWMRNSIGRSFGSTSSFELTFWSGYSNDHVNCWPVTFTIIVFGCLASMSSSVIQP